MVKFVLVHGAWHGAWCWEKLVPLLRAAGHEVIAPDLPGLGADQTPLATLSMADWTQAVLAAIRQTPGPAVLVGHSRGGAVISTVAEAAPELVERLIYLTAILPADGQSVLELAQAEIKALEVQVDAKNGSCTLKESDITSGFFADCSEEDIAFAKARLRPEPLFGLMTPIRVSAERFGTVPRYYVECTQDQAISVESQRKMQASWPVRARRTLQTSHSPFFSAPAALAEALQELAISP